MAEKTRQIVMRLDLKLDKKIRQAAENDGLTKAAWLRRLAIKTLESPASES